MRESKAIRCPSGEKRGVPELGAPKEVSWIGFEPSLSQIQISKLPERLDRKAILRPSGEMSWSICSRVEEISLVGGPFGPVQSGPTVRQTFVFLRLRK